MSFIVIEGLDGSGKSTQLNLLKKHLDKNNYKYEYIHFPTKDSPVFGDLVARFLRGELGSLEQVNPYLVALLFAGDQYNFSDYIRTAINNKKIVLNDRYVYSNLAYQCAKTKSKKEFEELYDWILNLQFNYFKSPKPELVIFLDVPFDFSKQKLTEQREGECRSYLNGKHDIHEADLSFQKKVKDAYQYTIDKEDNFVKIKCYDNNLKVLQPEAVSRKIIEAIKQKGVIS